ncbi:hypothetical protein RHM65_13745 [Pseudomonas sp. CCI4.2]|uniref:hypothetical protein n=1 Tax=Pseudomonas sp. CCI4.2 TaxID=3048620 RepID=UPI002AC90206|nr:hypothetical protein [Pseudomonas sp. CCI4.2]MEB0090315.1 hypothetical protein [Pseudomonas sp. CCI4.2]WPX51917.1 hypothetical protein RHM65_13745 [Pseudomonas sp. CCI4.2]
MKGTQLWIIAFFAVITNGFSLTGLGQASSGGLARSIEAKHEIAHAIEMAGVHKLMAGNPPSKYRLFELGPFTTAC